MLALELDVATTLRETPDIETSSEGYASRFQGPVGDYFLAVQAQMVLDLLQPLQTQRPLRVLDVGGGHAQIAGPLAARGHDVTVFGSDPVCRQRLDRLLPAGSFRFESGDLLRLPFPDRSFDVVVALRLLSHMEQWRELLAELARVAKRAVILDYPDLRSFNLLYGALFKVKKALEGNTRTFLCFRPGEVAAELARHGFGQPAERRQFFVPMVVHRKLGKAGFSRPVERLSATLGLTRALGSPVVLRAVRSGEPGGKPRK
ncbi:MAG TPA: class I SAM-dependent methyltransferase [Thermoanaerobaculia bacterium]|nr:class I SAM-dependent methyltransferase [Thermoanaerobaculia bacterium]